LSLAVFRAELDPVKMKSVNGDQSAAYRAHERDTWQGETFSRDEVHEMLNVAGLSVATVEDPGTQYFVVTARKGQGPLRMSQAGYVLEPIVGWL
jgi:hypothetical protein